MLRSFTLLELLCVIAIITLLASLVLGPAVKVLQRVRADQWSDQAHTRLRATAEQLNCEFQGKHDFPLVTLEHIEAAGWLAPTELRFLKDPDVTFTPFSGSDPDDKVVIAVELRRGFLSGASTLTKTKEAITRVPE